MAKTQPETKAEHLTQKGNAQKGAAQDRSSADPRLLSGTPPSNNAALDMDGYELIDVDGRSVPVLCRRNPRARRLILKVDTALDKVELVLPPGASRARGLRFLKTKTDWLAERLEAMPTRVAFVPGAVIPFLGHFHRLCAAPQAKRGVWADPLESRAFWPQEDNQTLPSTLPQIYVSGQPEHFPRRLSDWLKAQARRELQALTQRKTDMLGEAMPKITVRDTRSRWGSCSLRSGIAYSWRLILMPEAVREYVVSHEVAHLIEMNHSPAFWEEVEKLCPGHEKARQWLRDHGRMVHRYG